MEKKILIIDQGKWCYKIGFNNQEKPRILIYPKVSRDVFIDDIDVDRKITFENMDGKFINNPVRDTMINDFLDMQLIWDHLFYKEFDIDPKEYTLFFIESIYFSSSQREKIIKIMFEKYGLPQYILKIW